ncbi:HupE/UreJ family protein [Gynuella sunshinyii]|uniref:Hydrogenase/urease accessory protein n=1 Tax=Gynuella sunshinyii YC6258 TaxID=1445510 RepID=A0A0C5W1X6_9GAMM|nr:HupE/UreJ family protein [Gynuella sunshinyii]AJQ96674.1 hydrogenase/urease accessory protein [Gynuella sunshinyii YC6258]
MRFTLKAIITTLLLALPVFASAHTGVSTANGLSHGFGHPLGGLDHLLAMLAVGLWAAQMGGRAIWAVPCSFVGVMIVGGVLGFTGVALPWVEQGIALSVLLLGVLIAGAFRLPVLLSAIVVGVFALFHGHAHGAEMPLTAGTLSYVTGFVAATVLLHSAGIASGLLIHKTRNDLLSRVAGGAIAMVGVYLSIA